MDANVSQNVSPNVSPNFPQSKSARKRQRAKERELELKESDFDEWRRRKDHKLEYAKLWRQRNPDKCKEYSKRNSEKQCQKRKQRKIDLMNSLHFPISPEKDPEPRRLKDIAFCDKTDYSERGFM